MRTESAGGRTWLVLLACVLLGSGRAWAQEGPDPPLLLVDAETTVRSVDFRFVDDSELDEDQVRQSVAYRGPGALAGVRRALDFLPGVSAPEPEPFSPLELQRDVVRLRRLYRRAGFPDVAVDYDVTLDEESDEVAVTFVVDQGEPVVVDSVTVRVLDASGTAGADALPTGLEDEWHRRAARLSARRGSRYGEDTRAALVSETTGWFQDRGYPWARAEVAQTDTTDHDVHVHLSVVPGPRARVASITFPGRDRLDEHVLAREVPLHAGDWYSAARVSRGERGLYELDLVRTALGGVRSDQPRDSTVDLRFDIAESPPRLVSGRVGWRSEAGASGEAHWSHRNFLGGARTLTTSLAVETGWAALEQVRGRSGGLSAVVRQPYLFHPELEGTVGPFVRVRDDFRDRSILYGIETAVIYGLGALRNVTLQHEFSRQRVDEGFQLLSMRELAETGDRPFDPAFVKNVLKLSATYGTLDDRLDPHEGFLLEPNVEVSGPSWASDTEFLRAAMSATAALPLTRRVGLFVRAGAGRLWPFGESDPAGADPIRAVVGLRGVMFTAGGTSDVRGWGSGLLGPKVPDLETGTGGVVTADRWVPVGGLALLTGSVELALPFPLLPAPHRTFVFLDGGRVWTPGSRFEPADPELAREPWGRSVGGGLQIATPVGPVRLAVGYKLNPARVDLLSPGDVARSLAAGGDLSALETDQLKRWHLHLGIGRGL